MSKKPMPHYGAAAAPDPSAAPPRGGPVPVTPVDVAVRVVAAGLTPATPGSPAKVHATLVLTPSQHTGQTKDIHIESWPGDIGTSLARGIAVTVWPLDGKAGRGSVPPNLQTATFRMAPHLASLDARTANILWKDAVQPEHLGPMLDNRAAGQGILASLAPGSQTPEVHGTDRSVVSVELSLDRARQILDRLGGKPPVAPPSGPAKPNPELKAKIDEAVSKHPHNPVPASRHAINAFADTTSKDALGKSRNAAKAWADARTVYLDQATPPSEALQALVGAGQPACSAPPQSAAAAYAGTEPPAPAIAQAVAAHRLSSNVTFGEKVEPPPDAPTPDEVFAQRRLFALQAYPSLARLFRFVVDVECDASEFQHLAIVPGALSVFETQVVDHDEPRIPGQPSGGPIPDPKASTSYFLMLSAALPGSDANLGVPVWTAAKLRPAENGNPGHFYPCTREEIDVAAAKPAKPLRSLAVAEQLEGVMDLGQGVGDAACPHPRYDILTLDAITATAGEMHDQTVQTLATLGEPKDKQVDLTLPRTMRTVGFALADRWRQRHAVDRLIVSRVQHSKPAGPLLLDATDLTIGYKLDVGVSQRGSNARRSWHTLMGRRIKFEPQVEELVDRHLYPDKATRWRTDDAVLGVPAALRDNAAFAEEIIGAWRGGPLGLSTDAQSHTLSKDDLAIGMTFELPTRADGQDYTPPPLRYGWRYHLGLRPVFAGGVSMPLQRALGHYEKSFGGQLTLPASHAPGRLHRRNERIEGPLVLVPDWAFGQQRVGTDNQVLTTLPGRMDVEQSTAMIVRTVTRAENRDLTGLPLDAPAAPAGSAASAQRVRRILLPPSVALDVAALHGALDRVELLHDIVGYEGRELQPGRDPGTDPWDGSLRADTDEWVAWLPVPKAVAPGGQVWTKKSVEWRQVKTASRPRGGLRQIDHRAAWGGFPIFRLRPVAELEPVEGDVVVEPAVATSDGEIRDADQTRTLSFTPPGGGTVKAVVNRYALTPPPSGAAVFRPLPAHKADAPEPEPFYPDPATAAMIIRVDIPGEQPFCLTVPLYRGGGDVAVPSGYPDVVPVVLDLVKYDRKPGQDPIELVGGGDALWNYSERATLERHIDAPRQAGIPVRHAVVRLAAGEQAKIRTWCLPSAYFLRNVFEGTESVAALTVVKAGGTIPSDTRAADVASDQGYAAMTGGKLPPTSHAGPAEPCGMGAGSLPLPSAAQIRRLAEAISAFMQGGCLPEVAASTEIDAIHAIDVPPSPPSPSPGTFGILRVAEANINDKLHDSAPWALEANAAGTKDAVLRGRLTIGSSATGAVEVFARGAALAHGRFDDPERGRTIDNQLRGLWPDLAARENGVGNLFGFHVAPDGMVTWTPETLSLLSIEGFAPDTKLLDLVDEQKRKKDTSGPRVIRKQQFPDTCARWLTIFARGISRNGGLLRTRFGEQPARLETNDSPEIGMWLAATARPAKIIGMSALPSFAWEHTRQTIGDRRLVGLRRTPHVRVRMRRPWFTAGEGERLAVVLWPPNLFDIKSEDVQQDDLGAIVPGGKPVTLTDLPSDMPGQASPPVIQDTDLGLGGAWVTRWGADPIRNTRLPPGWLLSKANFPGAFRDADFTRPPAGRPGDGAVVQHALMPIPASSGGSTDSDKDPVDGYMTVTLVTFVARFDPEQEHWFADLPIDPVDVDSPFVRLGLVRYQPNAPKHLRVSEPIVEWTQVLPRREVTAEVTKQRPGAAALPPGMVRVEVKSRGLASLRGPGVQPGPETSPGQRPRVRMTLLRRNKGAAGEWIEAASGPSQTCPSERVAGDLEWTACFDVLPGPDTRWAVYVEEVDLLRPATYPDEPRLNTRTDGAFAETGPRFAAKLDLTDLLQNVPIPTRAL